jgi:hypothetical protein
MGGMQEVPSLTYEYLQQGEKFSVQNEAFGAGSSGGCEE